MISVRRRRNSLLSVGRATDQMHPPAGQGGPESRLPAWEWSSRVEGALAGCGGRYEPLAVVISKVASAAAPAVAGVLVFAGYGHRVLVEAPVSFLAFEEAAAF